MAKTTDFGKTIKIRLIELGRNQEWLMEQVRSKTGLYFDSAYLWKVMNGVLAPPKIIQAICEVLEVDYKGE